MAEIISFQRILEEDEKCEQSGLSLKENYLNSREFKNIDFLEDIKLEEIPNQKNPSVFIKFENISYSVSQGWKKESKNILHDLSGQIHRGDLTAILGPSGSGKTSLLKILSGYKDLRSTRRKTYSGKILINGKKMDAKKFRNISSYVMQDVNLFPNFTVKETMMVAVNLKQPEQTPVKDKEKMVTDVLETTSLTKCQNTMVRNISGGERKRLCIALELISDPSVLFLDEPTSGLDSTSCNQIISTLKSVAYAGCTIVCSIHQPSFRVLQNFDKLIILANGEIAYQGITNGLIPFLSSLNFHCPTNQNPADFVLSVITQVNVKQIQTLVTSSRSSVVHSDTNYCTKDTYEDTKLHEKKSKINLNSMDYTTSNWTQFRILWTRAVISIFRDTKMMKIRLIFHIFIGILLGTLYFNIGNNLDKARNNAFALYLHIAVLFMGIFISILQFPIEREIIRRELIKNWYSLRNYYIARTIADLPLEIIPTVITTTIFYWMTSQAEELYRFFYFTIISVLAAVTATSAGTMLSAGTNLEIGALFATFFIMFQALFGIPFMMKSLRKYFHWVSYFVYIRFAFEGCVLSVYGYDRQIECTNTNCLFLSPKLLLNELQITNTEIYIDFIVILATFLFYRIVGYFVLSWKVLR